MKILANGIFYNKERTIRGIIIRIWHTCAKYKEGKRGITRPELNIQNQDENTFLFVCPHCKFQYTLDKNIDLK